MKIHLSFRVSLRYDQSGRPSLMGKSPLYTEDESSEQSKAQSYSESQESKSFCLTPEPPR